MSVWLSDINGNPVPKATVMLMTRPYSYSQGHWNSGCRPEYTERRILNEDVNNNLILDEGEDTNGDGELTPLLSAGGSAPNYVVTNENGTACFALVYPKSSAVWTETEITAVAVASGIEITSVYRFTLPYSAADICNLPDSPYTRYTTLGDRINLMFCWNCLLIYSPFESSNMLHAPCYPFIYRVFLCFPSL